MDTLTIGLAQIAPVWLNRDGTMAKMLDGSGSGGERSGMSACGVR